MVTSPDKTPQSFFFSSLLLGGPHDDQIGPDLGEGGGEGGERGKKDKKRENEREKEGHKLSIRGYRPDCATDF